MTEKSDRTSGSIPLVGALGVLLLAGYIGAYYAMATPGYGPPGSGITIPIYETRWGPALVLRPVFSPIHSLDRHVRPELWKPK